MSMVTDALSSATNLQEAEFFVMFANENNIQPQEIVDIGLPIALSGINGSPFRSLSLQNSLFSFQAIKIWLMIRQFVGFASVPIC